MIEPVEAREIFERFKTVFSNSTDEFLPTPANVGRWTWHLANAAPPSKQAQWKEVRHSEYSELIEKRRVLRWQDFPPLTRGVYQHIAEHFPGQPVYACGSRVRGDYVEDSDGPVVRAWRTAAGKTDKRVSDFDFLVALDAVQIGALPSYADRLRHGVAYEEKIPIPMEEWDFSKLPEDQHADVIAAFDRGDWHELTLIHDEYHLSPYSYCCEQSGLKKWFTWAIQTGIIKKDGEQPQPDTGV